MEVLSNGSYCVDVYESNVVNKDSVIKSLEDNLEQLR